MNQSEKAVENESHFLINCIQHQSLRQNLFSEIKFAGFLYMCVTEKFRYLLTSKTDIKNVGIFIKEAFENRKNI